MKWVRTCGGTWINLDHIIEIYADKDGVIAVCENCDTTWYLYRSNIQRESQEFLDKMMSEIQDGN